MQSPRYRQVEPSSRSSASTCLVLALAVAVAIPAATPAIASDDDAAPVEETAVAPVSSSEFVPRGDGRRTIGRLPANLGRSAIGVFHADNLVPFLAGGAAAAAGSFADDEVSDSINSSGSGWGKHFATAGGPIWGSLFTAAMFTAGRFSDHARFRALTYDMVDAVIVNFGYSQVLKAAVGRERPNGETTSPSRRGTPRTRSPSPRSSSGTTAGSSGSPRTSSRASSGPRASSRTSTT